LSVNGTSPLRQAGLASQSTRRANHLRDLSTALSIPFRKNILFFRNENQRYIRSRPVPTEGRYAIVTFAGRDAVDADAPITNGADADGEDVWS
jgi:hypothetical protein